MNFAAEIESSFFSPADCERFRAFSEEVSDAMIRVMLDSARKSRCRVYFIQCTTNGFIKIGTTGDIKKRLRALQTSCPVPVELVYDFPGSYREESQLHGRWSHLRVKGEWFYPDPDLLAFIAKIRVFAGAA